MEPLLSVQESRWRTHPRPTSFQAARGTFRAFNQSEVERVVIHGRRVERSDWLIHMADVPEIFGKGSADILANEKIDLFDEKGEEVNGMLIENPAANAGFDSEIDLGLDEKVVTGRGPTLYLCIQYLKLKRKDVL